MLKNQKSWFVELPKQPKQAKTRVRPRLEVEDTVINGRIERKIEVRVHDYNVPFTPQTGESVHQGDLGYMCRNNILVEHSACYLSNIGRNPFSLQVMKERFGKSLGNIDKMYNIKS